MNNQIDIFSIIIILFILIVSYRLYVTSEYFQLKCIISTVDGEKYCVREREKLQQAADKLAKLNINLKKLIEHCIKKYPHDKKVNRLYNNFNPKKINETLPTSVYTAYSENKGEKLAFCLNTEKDNEDNLIDLNTLTYVACHELSHVMTKSYGHPPIFWENFKFLLIEAEKINIYKPIDYSKKNKEYCGMKITDSPYYDI